MLPVRIRVRNWLIVKLAGKSPIALNLKIIEGTLEIDGQYGLVQDCYIKHTPAAEDYKRVEKLRGWINEQQALRGIS